MDLNEKERNAITDAVWGASGHKDKQAAIIAVGAMFYDRCEDTTTDIKRMLELCRIPVTYANDLRAGLRAGAMMREIARNSKKAKDGN